MKLGLSGITKRFGRHAAVDGVDLEVRSGELAALLGPSGSGKTTLLKIIAGIEAADRGRVCFGERDVTALSVREREIGFVFQSYALFEHMTVAENVAFGLRVRKASPLVIRQRVDEIVEAEVGICVMADPHRPVEREAARGDVAGGIEEGGLAAHRRHGEQHRTEHRDDGQDEQDETLVLGLHLSRPSRSTSPSARRIAVQLQAVTATVAATVSA